MKVGDLVVNRNPYFKRVTNPGVICQVVCISQHEFQVKVVKLLHDEEAYVEYTKGFQKNAKAPLATILNEIARETHYPGNQEDFVPYESLLDLGIS